MFFANDLTINFENNANALTAKEVAIKAIAKFDDIGWPATFANDIKVNGGKLIVEGSLSFKAYDYFNVLEEMLKSISNALPEASYSGTGYTMAEYDDEDVSFNYQNGELTMNDVYYPEHESESFECEDCETEWEVLLYEMENDDLEDLKNRCRCPECGKLLEGYETMMPIFQAKKIKI